MTQLSRYQRNIGYLALVGALFSLAIHLSAVAGAPVTGMGAMFILFPLGIICFGILARHVNSRARSRGMSGVLALILPLPVWARVVFGAVFFYAMINFLLFFQATGGGTIERDANGHTVLIDHGAVIRTLDDAGVREVEGWQVRLFSGHILPFLLLPGLYFLFAAREGDEGRDEPKVTA